MNILCVSAYDCAGVGYALTEAVNMTTPHSMRCISQKIHPFGYPCDMLESSGNITRSDYQRVLKSADVVLFASSYNEYRPFGIPIPDRIPKAIWHGGNIYRLNYKRFNEQIHPKMVAVYAHKDLYKLGKDIVCLQAPYPTHKYSLEEKPKDGFVITHSPSTASTKGTEHFVEAIDELKRQYGDIIKEKLIKDVSFRESIKMKKDAHFFFDQIANVTLPPNGGKGYGVSLMEAGAFGCVGMGWTDWDDTPIYTVNNAYDIVDVVSGLIDDPDRLDREINRMYRFIHYEHSYATIAEKFVKPLERELG